MDLNLRFTTASCVTLDSLSSLSDHLGFALCSRDVHRTAFVALLQRFNLEQHTVGTPFLCPDCLYLTHTTCWFMVPSVLKYPRWNKISNASAIFLES